MYNQSDYEQAAIKYHKLGYTSGGFKDDPLFWVEVRKISMNQRLTKVENFIDVPQPDNEEMRRIARNARAKRNRQAREQAMRDCGLVKVKGAVSGRTYWE